MQIDKDDTLILIAHASMSCSLQNLSRLILVHWRVSCTKILTPPFLRDSLQSLPRSLYWSVYIKSISVCLRWCSDKQSTWWKYGDEKLINSSYLFNTPLTFWWYTVKIFVLFEFHWGSLLAWGCHLKHLRPCFLHFRLSFCILRYLITLIEPFIRELSPTLRSMFTIRKIINFVDGVFLVDVLFITFPWFSTTVRFWCDFSLKLLWDLFYVPVLNMCKRLLV